MVVSFWCIFCVSLLGEMIQFDEVIIFNSTGLKTLENHRPREVSSHQAINTVKATTHGLMAFKGIVYQKTTRLLTRKNWLEIFGDTYFLGMDFGDVYIKNGKMDTLPETNSAHLKTGHSQKIFRCELLVFTEGTFNTKIHQNSKLKLKSCKLLQPKTTKRKKPLY